MWLLLLGLASGVDEARARIDILIRESGAEVAVAFRTLDQRDEILISPDASFHAASTMKVGVMIELFAQAKERRLALSDRLVVRNEFKSIVDGSPFALTPEEDSEPALYHAVGRELALGELCKAMITRSSNLATNLLIEKLDVENIKRRMTSLGAEGMSILRGVEDGKAFREGKNNTTTARALLVLFEAIATGRAVDEEASREMVEILKRQAFNEGIPSGVPKETPVAHKTGEITRIHHDAGIVYGTRPYVVVVLVRGIDEKKESARLIAEVSRVLYRLASAQH